MRIFLQIAALASLLALAACEPKERAEWSPDGRRAAILADQRLFFTDMQGGLSEALADRDEGPGSVLIDAFDWLPDSSGLVLHRVRLVPRWEELAALLPSTDSARVESLAARVPELLRAAVTIHGDVDRADQLLGKLAPAESLALTNALRLALVNDAAPVLAALADAPLALASLEKGEKAETGFLLHEIAVLRPDSGKPAEVLARGLRGVHSMRVSPRHPFVACAFETGEGSLYELVVIPLDSSPAVAVSTEVTRAFDWTPDGTSLVYMSSISKENGGLVEIERRRILDDQGKLTDPLPGSEYDGELAYAVVAFAPRLVVLSSGEILFASHPASLPATADDLEESPRLYRLPADGGAPVAVPTEEGALPMDLGYFAPSPDGKRLAVVESGTDSVAVIDLKSGKSELVSPPHPGWKSRVMPSWRNADEFSFVSADTDSGRIRWMLWKNGETSDLSVKWPDKLTQGWMERK